MFKFQFSRTEETRKPTWNCQSLDFPGIKEIPKTTPLRGLWLNVWNRLCGKEETWPFEEREVPEKMVEKLTNATADAEPGRLMAGGRLVMRLT